MQEKHAELRRILTEEYVNEDSEHPVLVKERALDLMEALDADPPEGSGG